MTDTDTITKRAGGVVVTHPLFQAGEGGATPTSALQLRVHPIELDAARQMVAAWHSTLPRIGTGCIQNQPFPCFGAMYDGAWWAAAIWSNPVARNLPQKTWLELRRFAIRDGKPKNTASRLLRVMTMLLRRSHPHVERFISYQSIDNHAGTIYAAAGWTATTVNADGGWDRPGRTRPDAQDAGPKRRWELVVRTNTEGGDDAK